MYAKNHSTRMKSLLIVIVVCLLLTESDGKRKSKKNRISLPRGVRKIQEALDPNRIVNTLKWKTGSKDLGKYNTYLFLYCVVISFPSVMNWLHKVVDVGKGIANGVCKTVSYV
ncbi:uncharacterized protein ACWYII_001419 isoform 1-T2 [Salvelinus alpinus]